MSKEENWDKKIWFTRCPVANASEIAISNGSLRKEFEKDGIDVNSVEKLDDWDIHFTHDHPQFFREGGNIPPIWTKSNGIDVKLIGLSFLEQKQSILVGKYSPIKSIEDLKGKKLALPKRINDKIDFWRATVKHGFITALEANGIDRQDVEFVDIPIETRYIGSSSHNESVFTPESNKIFQKAETDALYSGNVDAIFSSGGRVIELELNGLKEIFDISSLDPEYRVNIGYPNILTVSGQLAREHPDIVTKYIKILIDAGNWAKNNKKDATKIFANGTYVSEDAFTKSHPDNYNEIINPVISDEGLDALNTEKNFLLKEGFIKSNFSVYRWADSTFIDEALA